MDAINRQSKLPLYQQLYEVLRGNIMRGEWKPGDLIPAESELIEQYGVSRITVRQVLDMLVQEGLIYRQRGRGSFVAHPTVEQVLQRLVSFTDDMRQRGFAPNTRILSAACSLRRKTSPALAGGSRARSSPGSSASAWPTASR